MTIQPGLRPLSIWFDKTNLSLRLISIFTLKLNLGLIKYLILSVFLIQLWVNAGAQSSISLDWTSTAGLHSKDWINSLNEGSGYRYSDQLSGLKLVYSKNIHKKAVISPFISISQNVFSATYNDILINNEINEKYVYRSIQFFGLGLSSQYFFNNQYSNFYLTGEIQSRFQFRNEENIAYRRPDRRFANTSNLEREILDNFNRNWTTFFTGLGFRLKEKRIFLGAEFGLDYRPFRLFQDYDIDLKYWRRINLNIGYIFK